MPLWEPTGIGTYVSVVNEALYADASQTGIDPTGVTASDFTALIAAANSAVGGRGRIKLLPNSHYKTPATGSGSQWDLTALSGITFEGPQDSTPRLNPSAIVEFQRTDANPCVKLWSADSIAFKGIEFKQAQAAYTGTMFDVLNSNGSDPQEIDFDKVRFDASGALLSTLLGITHVQRLTLTKPAFAGGKYQIIGQRNPAGTAVPGATYAYNVVIIGGSYGGAAAGGTNILNPSNVWVLVSPVFEPATDGSANFIGNDGTYMVSHGLTILAPEAADYTSGAVVFDLGAARGFNIASPNFEGSGVTTAIKFARGLVSDPAAGTITGGQLGGATTGIDFTTASAALGIDISNVDMQSTTTPLANYQGLNQTIVVRDVIGPSAVPVNYDPVARTFANGATFGTSPNTSAFDASGNLSMTVNRSIKAYQIEDVAGSHGSVFMNAYAGQVMTVRSDVATDTPLAVRANASQSVDVLDVSDSSGTPKVAVTKGFSLVVGSAALANAATEGFVYVPTVAGTPTGVPTAHTGTAPIVYDTTANKLWIYNGAWKSAAFA